MSLDFKQNQNLGIASAVVASMILVFAASNKSSSQTIYGHLHLHWQTKSNTSVLVKQKSNIKYIAHLSLAVDCCIIYISLDSKQNQNLGIAFAIVASVILVLPQINSHRKLMDTYICTDKWKSRSVLDVQKSNIQYKLTSPQRLIVASFVYCISLVSIFDTKFYRKRDDVLSYVRTQWMFTQFKEGEDRTTPKLSSPIVAHLSPAVDCCMICLSILSKTKIWA